MGCWWRTGVPGPAGGLSVKHPQLVVNRLVLRGYLLLLLGSEISEHPVYGRHLQERTRYLKKHGLCNSSEGMKRLYLLYVALLTVLIG